MNHEVKGGKIIDLGTVNKISVRYDDGTEEDIPIDENLTITINDCEAQAVNLKIDDIVEVSKNFNIVVISAKRPGKVHECNVEDKIKLGEKSG